MVRLLPTVRGQETCDNRPMENWSVYRTPSAAEQDLPVRAPALIWLFPGQQHGYGPQAEWSEHWLLFTGPASTAYVELGLLRRS